MKEEHIEQTPARGSHARLLIWLAITFIAVFAVYNNLRMGIWIDEAFAFDTATGSLSRTFRQALNFEMQPPLYYLLLNLWLRLSPSMEFGRLFSTACVLATVPVLYHLARALRLSAPATLPVLAAVCPYVLWAASEGRQYGLMILLAALATYLYVRVLTATDAELPRLSALYVGIWYLSLLTFYYSGALLASQVIGAVAIRRGAGRVLAAAAVVGLLMLPWLPTIWMQAADHPPGAALEPGGDTSLEGVLAYVGWAFRFALDSIFMAPVLRRPAVATLIALAIVAIVAAYRWPRTRAKDPMLGVFAVTALVPIAMILSLTFGSSPYSVQPRHLGFVVVSVLGLMALTADRFPLPRAGRLLGISMVVFGALCVVGFQRNNRRVTDWEAAARFVSTREAPGEVIFVFEPDAVLPFKYYYRGSRPVFGLPVDRLGDVFSIEKQAIHSIDQVAARVRAKTGPSGEFWVVARQPRPAWGRALLDEYLRDHAIPLVRGPPGGVDVARYRLPTSNGVIPARDVPEPGTPEARAAPGASR